MSTKDFFASLPFDKRLYVEDIQGSVAYTRALAHGGVITDKEAELIIMGLTSIREEIEKGSFPFRLDLEDIHMNIEARLYDKAGEVAGKLHTGRSRNDQVALDIRLFVKNAIAETLKRLKGFQEALLSLAEKHKDVVMPGYTHLQRAQPVLFAHHLLAYFEMAERDKARFKDCLKRADVLPLGSGALAGTAYPLDRDFLAKELGFREVSQNSIDAVSDRDFVLEFEAAASLTMMHLSRLAEELVLWSATEFSFVEVAEEFASGSSLMPQKRNPDAAELVRGKTGRVYGHLVALLSTLKALPLSYNRDLQEDKEGLFNTVDTLHSCLEVMAGMVGSLKVNKERMAKAAAEGYILATDVADYLVRKGVPFREAHGIVAHLVAYAQEKDKDFSQLALEEYKKASPLFEKDVYALNVATALSARDRKGGTAPSQVVVALLRARRLIAVD